MCKNGFNGEYGKSGFKGYIGSRGSIPPNLPPEFICPMSIGIWRVEEKRISDHPMRGALINNPVVLVKKKLLTLMSNSTAVLFLIDRRDVQKVETVVSKGLVGGLHRSCEIPARRGSNFWAVQQNLPNSTRGCGFLIRKHRVLFNLQRIKRSRASSWYSRAVRSSAVAGGSFGRTRA